MAAAPPSQRAQLFVGFIVDPQDFASLATAGGPLALFAEAARLMQGALPVDQRPVGRAPKRAERLQAALRAWLQSGGPEEFTLLEACEGAGVSSSSRSELTRVGIALGKLGYERVEHRYGANRFTYRQAAPCPVVPNLRIVG